MIKYLYILIMMSLISPKTKVAFIGDSLTAHKYGWQELLSSKKNFDYTNLAKSGTKTSWMLNKLETDLKYSNHKYNRIYIYGGVNDVFSLIGTDIIISNIQKMVDLSILYGAEPIVLVGYDAKSLLHGCDQKYIDRYSDLQIQIKSKIKRAYIIDACKLSYSDSNDGLHLNDQGIKKFFNWVYLHDEN